MTARHLTLLLAACLGALPLAAPLVTTAAPTLAPPGWNAESNQMDAQFGRSVASAGDVNGDGFADVIVGAPFYDNGEADEGRASVYLGSATGLATNPAWTVESNVVNGNLGWSVASAGDVNQDGYDDVIVGVPGDSNGQFAEGRAYVYHGSATGLAATPARMLEAANQQFAGFGGSVAGAGDVNNDGYADVIVGASSYGNGQSAEGRAWVFHGSPTGVSSTPAWGVESNQAGAEFGYSVGTAGDVNGDGYADVIVGAWRYDNLGAGSNDGRAFVHQGSAGGLALTPAWTLEGNQAGAQLGQAVATAGDFNGDGYADVIVGAPTYDTTAPAVVDAGRVYVAFGSAAGLQAATAWTPSGTLPPNPLRLGTAVGAADVNGDGFSDLLASSPNWGNGVVLTLSGNPGGVLAFFVEDRYFQGDAASQQLGFAAAGAGDVDGDGYDEVIAGANLRDNGESDEGGAFAYYGVPEMPYPWRDGDMITHYQTVWGAPATVTNAAGLVLANFDSVYPLGYLEVGIPGAGGFSLVFTGPGALLQFLPTVGIEGPLFADLVNPISSTSGTFGGDVIALKLNIDFSDANVLQGAAGLRFGDLRLCRTPFAGVNNLTVRQVAAMANTILGSGEPPLSFNDIYVTTVLLTDAFEDGIVSQYARDHLVSGACPTSDLDNDAVIAREDNCSAVANAAQCDSDGDGYGNRCDGDLNNNGFTNAQDSVLFRAQLGQTSAAPTYNKADLNCSGFVNAQDSVLFRQLLGTPPGPSGLACAGTAPCPAP